MDQGEGEWTPPTEAELKVMAAKRERSNKISQLMGGYLLKGYKMLATTCPSCETILLRSKDGKDYCVTCAELSTDVSKDDPAVSHSAAERQAAEGMLRSSEEKATPPLLFTRPSSAPAPPPPTLAMAADSQGCRARTSESTAFPRTSANTAEPRTSGSTADPVTGTVTDSIDVLQSKLHSATQNLRSSQHPDECIQWCKMIQHCADSMLSLYTLKSKLQHS